MILLIKFPFVILPVCNKGIKNVPFLGKILRTTIGFPFENGDEIISIENKYYTDLPLFSGDSRYAVGPEEKLLIVNSVSGTYDKLGQFNIDSAQLITHYLIEGIIYDCSGKGKFMKEPLYVPIEAIHGKFKLTH